MSYHILAKVGRVMLLMVQTPLATLYGVLISWLMFCILLSFWRFTLWRWHDQMDRGLRSTVAMESSSPFITLWSNFSRQKCRVTFSQRMPRYHHFPVRELATSPCMGYRAEQLVFHAGEITFCLCTMIYCRYWKCADEVTSKIHQQILSGTKLIHAQNFCVLLYMIRIKILCFK